MSNVKRRTEVIAKSLLRLFNIKYYGMPVPPVEQTQEDFEKSVNKWKEQQAKKHG